MPVQGRQLVGGGEQIEVRQLERAGSPAQEGLVDCDLELACRRWSVRGFEVEAVMRVVE